MSFPFSFQNRSSLSMKSSCFPFSSEDKEFSHVSVGERRYGKSSVRLVTVTKQGEKHFFREFRVQCLLTLSSVIDFTEGDNRDIVATDSVKNTIYILAQRFGVTTIEKFSVALGEHFLKTYSQVIKVDIEIEEIPWQRAQIDRIPHNHVFLGLQDCIRTCSFVQEKGREKAAVLKSGFKDFKILKTTQTGFTGFVRDEYTTLPEATDRLFRTSVTANYEWTC
eukprot:Sdes_comp21245_c0_seq1m19897